MSLDMEMIERKLNAIKDKKSGNKPKNTENKKTWSPPESGDFGLRIVPCDDPFVDMYFHYKIGPYPLPCLRKNFNEKCPICEFAFELWNTKTEDGKAQAKKYFPKQRFFSPVVVRGEEEKGVRWWGYGETIYVKLLKKTRDKDYGDITHAETGFDFTLSYTKSKNQKEYSKSDVEFRPKPSTLLEKVEDIPALLAAMPKFYDIYKKPTEDEIREHLQKALQSTSFDPAAIEAGKDDTAAAEEEPEGTATLTGEAAIDAAFSDIDKA